MMKIMDDLVKLIGYSLCRVMPIDQVSAIGARMGRYNRKKQQELDVRVLANLDKLGWSTQHHQVLTELRRESGRAALEMLIADRIAKAGRIHWEPNPEFESVVAQERSIVFVTIHMSNLGDVTGAAIVNRLPNYRMGFVTRKISSGVDNWIATQCRNQTLGKRDGWVLSGTRNLARQMVEELRKPPACILLHIDEARQHQVHVPTFGRTLPKQVNLNQAVRLAQLAGACLVPLIVVRNATDRVGFVVRVLSVIDTREKQFRPESAIAGIDSDMHSIVAASPARWLQIYHLRY